MSLREWVDNKTFYLCRGDKRNAKSHFKENPKRERFNSIFFDFQIFVVGEKLACSCSSISFIWQSGELKGRQSLVSWLTLHYESFFDDNFLQQKVSRWQQCHHTTATSLLQNNHHKVSVGTFFIKLLPLAICHAKVESVARLQSIKRSVTG